MMAICEKCWGDAYIRMRNTGRSQYDCYLELLDERKDNPCKEGEYEKELRNRNPNEHKRQTQGDFDALKEGKNVD